MTVNYGHVPEENLEQYRRIKRIADQFKSLGNSVSGRGQYADANMCWRLSKKYADMANELRVVIPDRKQETAMGDPTGPTGLGTGA